MAEVTRDHYVYRLYDEAGALLYVGVTKNPAQRAKAHASGKPWWPEVVSSRLVGPMPRDDAYALELQAIATENPAWNKAQPTIVPKERTTVEGPLAGCHEIGQMLGVGRQRVYQLVSRRDFPAPVAELAMGNVWRRADVLTWAAGKGRAVSRPENGRSGGPD